MGNKQSENNSIKEINNDEYVLVNNIDNLSELKEEYIKFKDIIKDICVNEEINNNESQVEELLNNNTTQINDILEENNKLEKELNIIRNYNNKKLQYYKNNEQPSIIKCNIPQWALNEYINSVNYRY